MEAGKERLTRDSVRDATRDEVHHLKRENVELKSWSPICPLRSIVSKSVYTNASGRRRYQDICYPIDTKNSGTRGQSTLELLDYDGQ